MTWPYLNLLKPANVGKLCTGSTGLQDLKKSDCQATDFIYTTVCMDSVQEKARFPFGKSGAKWISIPLPLLSIPPLGSPFARHVDDWIPLPEEEWAHRMGMETKCGLRENPSNKKYHPCLKTRRKSINGAPNWRVTRNDQHEKRLRGKAPPVPAQMKRISNFAMGT